ncbi:MAG: NfeD family protein [Bacteroidales bacterium]
MSWILIILFILVGIVLMILEVLVLPGHVVFGLLGFVSFVFGIVESYLIYGNLAGNITLFSSFVLAIVCIILSLRGRTWRRAGLYSSIDGKAGQEVSSLQKGDKGITVGRLAPMGKVRFQDKVLEVKSDYGFVDSNCTVEVVKVQGNKVLVKPCVEEN